MQNTQLARVTYSIIIFSFVITLLYVGRTIFIPIAFAIVLAFLLYPLNKFFERFKFPRILAIIVALIIVFLLVAGITFFFSTQFISLFQNIRDFWKNLASLLERITSTTIESLENAGINVARGFFSEQPGKIFETSSAFVGRTITSSTILLANTGITIVYTFLFLLYRTAFKKFILFHFKKKRRKKEVERVLTNIQKVGRSYFYGLFIIILILGTLNGFGLWIIGIDYPFLFGFFAAFLAIIPYIGTFIGGLLPTLYALVNYDSIWKPIMVVILYVIVQTLEGNILTPKIVGSKVSLNPLFALFGLLIGSVLWGIAGMILFIPLMAILKVVLDHIDHLKPYGLLLSSDFGHNIYDPFKNFNLKLGLGVAEEKEPKTTADLEEEKEKIQESYEESKKKGKDDEVE
ncbi:MAG: AI-2E family transporter [Bacteroidota bacterium]